MIKRFVLTLLLALLTLFVLVGCRSGGSEEGPAGAYWGYYEACENGEYDTAEGYLAEEAQSQIETIGVCGFTHDAINRVAAERGMAERTFSDEPQVDVQENSASITWIDDSGNLAIVSLTKDVGGWKVSRTIWST
jgi:hypothetical protein